MQNYHIDMQSNIEACKTYSWVNESEGGGGVGVAVALRIKQHSSKVNSSPLRWFKISAT